MAAPTTSPDTSRRGRMTNASDEIHTWYGNVAETGYDNGYIEKHQSPKFIQRDPQTSLSFFLRD